MVAARQSLVHHLRQEYRPFREVADWLQGFLHAALAATETRFGTLCFDFRRTPFRGLPAPRFLIDSRIETLREAFPPECCQCPLYRQGYHRVSSSPGNLVPCGAHRLPCGSNLAVPIRPETADPFGVLTLAVEPGRAASDGLLHSCHCLTRRLAFQLLRHEVRNRLKASLGRDLLLVGLSEPLHRVDKFIARASQTDLPALIVGEFGVEKDFVAGALHFAGPRRRGDFVKVNCAAVDGEDLRRQLPELLRGTRQRTIFLHEVDQLEWQLQARLAALLEAELGLSEADAAPGHTRLVTSSRQRLAPLVAAGLFRPSLQAQLAWLSTEIPPLRERPEDLLPIVEFVLHRHGRTRVRFSEEALAALEKYPWPGNVTELERTVVRLATLAETDVVGMDDLATLAPGLLERAGNGGAEAPPARALPPADTRKVAAGGRDLPRLIEALTEERYGAIGAFHPGLARALRYLVENLHRDLCLGSLARHACLSPSHLSHLFRSTLGVSYKPLLIRMRVARARRLLASDPHAPITGVADAVGFGDLSHFERTFKRLVGCTPRDYRRRHLPRQIVDFADSSVASAAKTVASS